LTPLDDLGWLFRGFDTPRRSERRVRSARKNEAIKIPENKPLWRFSAQDVELVIIKPETFIRWHRAGFRLFWLYASGIEFTIGTGVKASHHSLSWRLAYECGDFPELFVLVVVVSRCSSAGV
jgi:hypothetical protein